MEWLLLFPAAMIFGTVTYQNGRKAGREEQKRSDIWVRSHLWIGGQERVVTEMTMSSDGSGYLSWDKTENAERRWRAYQ